MRSLIEASAFFSVVPPVSRLMTSTFAVVTALGAVCLAVDEQSGTQLLRPLLLLHAFASASGFSVPARRGHYDLLLTRALRRSVVATVHAVRSGAPGLMSWCAFGVADLILSSSRTVLTVAVFTAFIEVFAIAWATTVSLPRFAGAIGWLLVLALVDGPLLDISGSPPPSSVPALTWAISTARIVVAPATLLSHADALPPATAAGALTVALIALWLGVYHVSRESVPLEAGQ